MQRERRGAGPVERRARRSVGRRAAGLVLLPALLVPAGCAVETVEGEIADQQLCVAAQPAVEQVEARAGLPVETAEARPDLLELAGRASDPGLRTALTDVADTLAEAVGDPGGSAAWAQADRAAEALTLACQRLTAF